MGLRRRLRTLEQRLLPPRSVPSCLACGGPSPWPLLHLHVRKGERVPRTCADCGRPVDQQGRVLAEHLKVVNRQGA